MSHYFGGECAIVILFWRETFKLGVGIQLSGKPVILCK